MSRLQGEVLALVQRERVVARHEHPALRGSIDRLVKTGVLRAVLPGVYAEHDAVGRFDTRVAALFRWSPDAVITEAAAARLSFWPSLQVDVVDAAVPRRGTHPGFRLETRQVPPELVVERGGLRMTCPALTALDLCSSGTEVIDQVLRTQAATLTDLWRCLELTPGRRGNRQRLRHLTDSPDQPWSAAERLCHRLLHEAGVEGWEANLPVRAGGRRFYLDVAFADVGLVVEIDGLLHMKDQEVFENDRWRQNALVLDGWIVLRFTWAMLTRHPDVVIATIRDGLEMARRGRPTTFRHSTASRDEVHARSGRPG